MALYETVQIARQDISASQVESLTEEFGNIVTENGGTVVKTEQCGLRTLAYRINKNRKGHYTIYYLDAPADAVAEMERQMRLHEDIMRYMTLRVDEHPEGPSILSQQAKGDRGSRGDRGDRGDRPPRGDREDRRPRRDGEEESKSEESQGAEA